MIARRSWLGIDSANDRIESETPQDELAERAAAREAAGDGQPVG